jgi:predicted dinucleotide-binding enzyme
MKITIIGAGNMGRGIGTRAIAGGHEVEILDRDPAEARALADQLGGSASALDPAGAFGGEIVVFAVYYPGIKEAVEQYADRLAGKVVVDITNPVDSETWDRLATPPGSSSAEEVARLVPQGTPVVKGVQHDLCADAARGRGRRAAPRCTDRRGRRRREAEGLAVRRRRGAEADRRRPARARSAARAARLPAYLHPAAARPRLREHDQAPSVTLRERDAIEQR